MRLKITLEDKKKIINSQQQFIQNEEEGLV